jgi:hypothetical protein
VGDQDKNSTVEILIGGPYKDHPYGHAALHVTTPTSDRVYDYGRYGKTWGMGNSSGEGIMQVWTDSKAYIAEENRLNRVTTGYSFPVTEEQAKKINAYFDNQIAGGPGSCATCGPPPVRTKTPVMSSYRLPTDYYALGPNCTTTTMNAAQIALPDLAKNQSKYIQGQGLGFSEKAAARVAGWPDHVFMPADLQSMLDGETAGKATVKKYSP